MDNAEPPPPETPRPHRTRDQKVSLFLAWVCWTACVPLILLTVSAIFDSGPRGPFIYGRYMFGLETLILGELGRGFYNAGNHSGRQR